MLETGGSQARIICKHEIYDLGNLNSSFACLENACGRGR